MIKKLDLTKKFELVVQQEIKNYNDSLNNVLQSIRDLKIEIENLKKDSQSKEASTHAKQCDLSLDLNKALGSVDDVNKRLNSFKNDQAIINQRSSDQFDEICNVITSKLNLDKSIEEKFKGIWSEIVRLNKLCTSNLEVYCQQLDKFQGRFNKALNSTKKEILEAPSEASLVRDQLDEKINSHKVDVQGIMRELLIYKKQQMINEKKIENLYTLIERLQKDRKE